MIISRAPVRITLGGGGTDLKSYYAEHGGFLIAGAIDLYVYVCMNRRFFDTIRLSYSASETVDSVDEIKHPVFRECLKKYGIDRQIEIASISDVTANCGLGTSSTFTVALINAIHAYKRDYVSLADLAEEACDIEIDRLQEPIGKQDQYIAAFGGVTCLTFDTDGTVHVEPLKISPSNLQLLEKNILMFYTGIERRSSEILRDQDENSKKKQAPTGSSRLGSRRAPISNRATWAASANFSTNTGSRRSVFPAGSRTRKSTSGTRPRETTGRSAGRSWARAEAGS
jgi:D-glycero-alpha-D-manno-heptose-7-phosphate kinase